MDITKAHRPEGSVTRLLRQCTQFHYQILLWSFFLFFAYWPILISQTRGVFAESLKVYPFFHYFIQNIHNGHFPLWTPYSHAGEPFWTYIQYMGFANPITTLLVSVSYVFGFHDYALIHHVNIFLSILTANIGAAFLCRYVLNKHDRFDCIWIIIPIIFLGTFSLVPWKLVFGTIYIATFLPWIMFGLLKLFDTEKPLYGRSRALLTLTVGLLCGAQFSMYNVGFVGFSLAVFVGLLLCFWCFDRRRRQELPFFRVFMPVVAITALTLLSFGPGLILASKQDLFFSVGRTMQYLGANYDKGFLPQTFTLKQDFGQPAWLGDLLRSIDFLTHLNSNSMQMVYGCVGFLLLIVGLLYIRCRLQALFVLFSFFIALLSLGHVVGLSTVLYRFVPGFSIVRHLQFFLPIFYFSSLVVLTYGCMHVIEFVQRFWSTRSKHLILALGILSLITALWRFFYELPENTRPRAPTLNADYLYMGADYRPRREYIVPPQRIPDLYLYEGPEEEKIAFFKKSIEERRNLFRDRSHSFGEPMLLYRDSVEFHDLASQMTMPYQIWTYIAPQDMPKFDLIGVTTNKLTYLTTTLSAFGETKADLLGLTKDKLRWLQIYDSQTLQVDNFSTNELSLTAYTPEPNRLFYSQNLMWGWQINIDGVKHRLEASSEHPFFEVPISAGTHHIILKYAPKDVIWGYALNYLCQIGLLVMVMTYITSLLLRNQ